MPDDVANLRSQIAVLEELLTVQERTVIEQSSRLEQAMQRALTLFQAINDAAFVMALKEELGAARFLAVNDVTCELLGYTREELLSMGPREIHEAASWDHLVSILPRMFKDGHHLFETVQVAKSGRKIPVEINARKITFEGQPAVLGLARDVSERKRLERDLQQSQRLEAVGQLAAGIAHEINTPIQFVRDNLSFLADAFQSLEEAWAISDRVCQAVEAEANPAVPVAELRRLQANIDWKYVEQEIPKAIFQSLEGARQITAIVSAMREFAHQGRKEKAAADLNRALANTLIVARNEIKHVADVETDFHDLPPVVCHIADMNQVFLNLLVNAAHAVADVVKTTQIKGKITIRTRHVNDTVVISISDTGYGIAEEIRSRVFDPFFTTKEPGRGTGQGLSIARSTVVKKHGGSLTFEPNLPQGTTFLVTLPITPSDESAPGIRQKL